MIWHESHIRELALFLGVWFYVVYPLVKLLSYAAWCHWSAAYLEIKPGRSAFKDGLLRFAIGLAFGGAAYLIVVSLSAETLSRLQDRASPRVYYVAAFVPLRWVEWWIMERVIAVRPGGLLTTSRGSAWWRAGGVLVSFASDAPLFFLAGILGVIA
ncbi:MAG: hypothetical protein ACHQ49_03070 [Elusimicrobiota bacterium]